MTITLNIIKKLPREPFGAVIIIARRPAEDFVCFAARGINIYKNAKQTKQSIHTA